MRTSIKSARWSDRLRAIGVSVMFALGLAACQATPPEGYGASQQPQENYLAMFRLDRVDVDYSRAERPLLVDSLDADVGISTATRAADFLGLWNGRDAQMKLETAITAHVQPHIRSELGPLFTGSRPLRAVVDIRSVFIRSRASLQQLTGATVTVNGKRRPGNAQFVAGIVFYDLETGIPVQEVAPITRIDDGSITLAGGTPNAPGNSKAPRLNQLSFEFAQAVANAVKNNAGSEDFTIDANEADKKVLWSKQGKLF